MSNPNPPPTTTSAQTPPATPAQMMALITELHSELTAQRSRIAQLTSAHSSQADQATRTVTASSSSTPKTNKPPTFDGKSPPDSWIAHMTSYVHGLTDEHAFDIAIIYLTVDAHDWFISNQASATAAGHPRTSWASWVALTEALARRFSPLNKAKLAHDKLSRWRQLRDVPSYNTDFHKIILDIPHIGIDEQIDRYARGLKPYIWSELCTTDYTVRPTKTPPLVPTTGPTPSDTAISSHLLSTTLSSAFETPHLGLLVAKGFVNSAPCKILFDNGAEISYLTSRLAKQLQVKTREADQHATFADGKSTPLHQTIVPVNLKIEAYTESIYFAVFPLSS
jgi:Retrotransposon gag protein